MGTGGICVLVGFMTISRYMKWREFVSHYDHGQTTDKGKALTKGVWFYSIWLGNLRSWGDVVTRVPFKIK